MLIKTIKKKNVNALPTIIYIGNFGRKDKVKSIPGMKKKTANMYTRANQRY